MIKSKIQSAVLAMSLLMPVFAYADIKITIAAADGDTKVYSLSLDKAKYPSSVDFDIEGITARLTIHCVETSEKGISCTCTASVIQEGQETVVEETTIDVAWNESLVISGPETGVEVTVVATP